MDRSKQFVAQVHNLAVTYFSAANEPIRALDDVSIGIRAGEVVDCAGSRVQAGSSGRR